MQVLELKPLKNKKLKLILIESEFPIDWRFNEEFKQDGLLENFFFISREYIEFIEKFVNENKLDFVIEDKVLRDDKLKGDEDEFESIFKRAGITYETVGIPEYALNYLSSPIINKKELVKKFSIEISEYKKRGQVHYNDPHFQQLVIWYQYLKDEIKKEEKELEFKVRESWMMMGIIEIAKNTQKKEITGAFICDKRHFDGILFLANELNVVIEIINIQKIPKNLKEDTSIDEVVNSSILEIMPIKVKKKEKEDEILYFFDTDEYCSPFDINMAYDAGFEVVIPYSKMTAERVTKLVQDAIFSRKAGAPSVFFIGGSDVEEGERISNNVLKALVKPFGCPVIIDPRGAHTTASAIVAKTIEVLKKHDSNDLANKSIAILGGTGPVGQICAIIAARLGAKSVITSRREDYVKTLANKLTIKAGKNAQKIEGKATNSEEDYFNIVKDADIIWSVGKAGIQMISKEVMKKLSSNKIVVDINLVPPYGIEGIKPEFYNKEFFKGIYGIGALDIGRLKYKIEKQIFKQAIISKGKRILDFNIAFEVANRILFGEQITISYT